MTSFAQSSPPRTAGLIVRADETFIESENGSSGKNVAELQVYPPLNISPPSELGYVYHYAATPTSCYNTPDMSDTSPSTSQYHYPEEPKTSSPQFHKWGGPTHLSVYTNRSRYAGGFQRQMTREKFEEIYYDFDYSGGSLLAPSLTRVARETDVTYFI
ncbi:hypothetical protein GYMLUDRAFT_250692 [Collybiopsis luxurians FD-317 M1]|uniref:Uncharacterized protein n=1 Tax=Collybiopsis luxurians FD-317 M1 TaxID=944289 RepID=A0A0D0BU35_9AGAR|nr:hypothetical protein GYMLUDRAFT_250692 [Collybiopsis luxurians FD-317 M1]